MNWWVAAILVALASVLFALRQNPVKDTRWQNDGTYNVDTDFCNIERLPLLSRRDFLMKVAGKRPIIFRDDKIAQRNLKFREMVDRDTLLNNMRDKYVKLSSSNSYSHARMDSTLGEYLEKHILTHAKNTMSNETWYFFGENYDKHWKDLNTHYEVPPFPGSAPPVSLPPALSFGIGGRGSGVAFHFHGQSLLSTQL